MGADSQTNLCPISIELPSSPFHSGPLGVDADPHTESAPQRARPPFLAPVGTRNLALHKRVTSSDTNCSPTTLALITDGYKGEDETRTAALVAGKQWVQIDLEVPCTIYAVVLWHLEYRDRVFHCVAVQSTEDAEFTKHVYTLFNNDYADLLGLGPGSDPQYYETNLGRLIDAKGVKARYVRCYSRGNTDDRLNWYREVEVWGLPGK